MPGGGGHREGLEGKAREACERKPLGIFTTWMSLSWNKSMQIDFHWSSYRLCKCISGHHLDLNTVLIRVSPPQMVLLVLNWFYYPRVIDHIWVLYAFFFFFCGNLSAHTVTLYKLERGTIPKTSESLRMYHVIWECVHGLCSLTVPVPLFAWDLCYPRVLWESRVLSLPQHGPGASV